MAYVVASELRIVLDRVLLIGPSPQIGFALKERGKSIVPNTMAIPYGT